MTDVAVLGCIGSHRHPPDEQRPRIECDEDGNRVVEYDAKCPHCKQWVPVIVYERWPDGHFPRMAVHDRLYGPEQPT